MAEIIYADGRRETVAPMQAPEGEMSIRRPSVWERSRMATSGALEKAHIAPELAKGVSDFVIPGSTGEAGIQAGLALMPGVGPAMAKTVPGLLAKSPLGRTIVERLMRYALPATGGAVGASVGGQDPISMGMRGALSGPAGDAGPLMFKGIRRAAGAGGVAREDASRIGGALGASVPPLAGAETAEGLYTTAITSRGRGALDTARQGSMDAISASLRGTSRLGGPAPGLGGSSGHDTISVPSLRGVAGTSVMSFRDAVGWLSKLADEGWLLSQGLKEGPKAVDARGLRAAARKEIVSELDGQVAGLGAKFDQAQKLYARGLTYLDLLKKPGVIEDGQLNMNALRDAVRGQANQRETYAQKLEKLSTPAEIARFYQALTRGGPMSGRDKPGSLGLHGTAGASGPHLRFSTPRFPSFTGAPEQLPRAYRPGMPSGGPAISFGLLGLTRGDERDE